MAVTAVITLMIFMYLQRYVVYTNDGAQLELPARITGENAAAPAVITPELIIDDPVPSGTILVSNSFLTASKNGSFVTIQQLLEIQEGNGELLVVRVKNDTGTLFYDSSIFPALNSTAGIDAMAIKDKIASLKSQGVQLIACISCFNDDYYAAANPNLALKDNGGLTYRDSRGGYWLDPSKTEVTDYLTDIAGELSALGFEEIMLDSFAYPPYEELSDSEMLEILADASLRVNNRLDHFGLKCSIVMDSLDINGETPEYLTVADNMVIKYDDSSAIALESIVSTLNGSNVFFITNSTDALLEDFRVIQPE